jgi:cation diffusion facilitator family transporter
LAKPTFSCFILSVQKSHLQRAVRVTLVGMIANTVLAATKMVAGVLGHSHALVADGVESLADLLSSAIVWRGLVVAATPADEDHPYGHGKAEPIAAAMVSTMLILAAAWIIFSAAREIAHPHQAPAPFTLGVLVVVVIVKELLFRFVRRAGISAESSAVQTDAWHHRSDAITSLAAGVGIGIALIGGKGYEQADDWAAVVAALVIAWNGWRLLSPAVNELMDKSPQTELIQQIRQIAETIPGADRVEKCFVRKMGYHFYVDMHVEVDPQMTVQRSHVIAHEVKDRIRENIPSVRDVLVHVEPGHNQRESPIL